MKSFLVEKSLVAASIVGCVGCSAGSVGSAADALGSGAAPSIFDVAASQSHGLPPGIPDDLLSVNDPLHPGQQASLGAGVVVGAWTTVPDAMGNDPVLIYQCRPDPDQPGPREGSISDFSRDYTWVVVPHAALAPIGVDPSELAAALPFSAVHTRVERGGIYLVAPWGPAWTVAGQIGEGAAATTANTQIIGEIDDVDPTPDLQSIAWYRYRTIGSYASEAFAEPTIERADFVLRLDTVGGLGPDDEGAPCDPGSLDVPSPFTADFYFVEMPWSYASHLP
jgi:hypothetical protein